MRGAPSHLQPARRDTRFPDDARAVFPVPPHPVVLPSATSSHTQAWYSVFPQGNMNRGVIRVEIKTVTAALATDSTHLAAPEGRAQIANIVRVDPHKAGYDRLGDALSAIGITRPNICRQAVAGVVGDAEDR